MRNLLPALFLASTMHVPAGAQGLESQTPLGPWQLEGSRAAFDSARGRVVVFGGGRYYGPWGSFTRVFDGTWEFDGAVWRRIPVSSGPRARVNHSLVFDAVRNRTILFGGTSNPTVLLGDTWLFDGSTWVAVSTPLAPPAREGAGFAFDTGRGRSVLVGGLGPQLQPLNDTWEFDGTNWTQGPSMPFVGSTGPIAYDAARARIVMLRGSAQGTWEYDGVQWTQATPVVSPPVSFSPSSASAEVGGNGVLVVGIDVSGAASTWRYDGLTWSLVPVTNTVDGQLVTDTNTMRTLLLHGLTGTEVRHLAAGVWLPIGAPVRTDHALAFDPRLPAVVMFGGSRNGLPLGDTWLLAAGAWTSVTTPVAPAARYGHAMAYDSRRGRTILFGGNDGAIDVGDTWSFDGAVWSQIVSAGPPPRRGAAMTYDSARDRMVLVGGQVGASSLADTWEFDGATWSQNVTAGGQAWGLPRTTYDSRRGITVLVALSTATAWEYDGTVWIQASMGTWGASLSFDQSRGRVVVAGGMQSALGAALYPNTWEYDGAIWTQAWPSDYWPTPVAYDSVRHRLVGTAGAGLVNESVVRSVPSFTRHGIGCLGSNGTPSLGTTPNTTPALGSTFPLLMTSLPIAPSFAYLTLGFDLATWNGLLLPINLGALGMPNCHLWVEPLAGSLLPTTAGTASFALPIPALPALAGRVLGAQALSLDPQAPGAVAAASNGVILRLF